MAATINIDIDADQAKFLAFYSAFQSFSKTLDGAAGKWEKINDNMKASVDSSKALVVQGSEAMEQIDKARTAIFSMRPVTDSLSHGWNSISTSTAKVAFNIKEATLALMKWSGITALVGGGAWGVGTLGMMAIGSGVTAERSAALGAGTSYGGSKAFNIAFRRFGDPEGVLSRIGVMKGSAEHSALTNLGLTDHEIDTMDTADLSAKAYKLLGEKAQNVNPSMLKDWLGQYRFSDAFSLEQTRLAKNGVKTGEMGELQGIFSTGKGRFNISDESQVAWVSFVLEMEIAKGRLNKTFAGALAPLTPSLIKISDSFTHLAEKLGRENGPLAHTLERFNAWLLEVTKDVTEKRMRESIDNFISKIKDFVSLTAEFVKKLAKMLQWFGLDVPTSLIGNGGSTGRGRAPGFRGGASGMGGESGGGGGGTGRSASGGGTGAGVSTVDLSGGGDFNTRGVKNKNPGNIAYGAWAAEHGAIGAAGTDTGHGVAVFPSFEAGSQALEDLALAKYNKGKLSADALIAGQGGWTPGNHEAAANVARSMGIRPGDDLHLTDARMRARFRDALMKQELGPAGARYVRESMNQAKVRVTIKKTPGNDSTEAANAAGHQTP